MIIQCRQCRTKFRFADHLMEGDGVWLRCSHCQHVFFQDNPQTLNLDNEQVKKVEEFPADKTLALPRTPDAGDEDNTLFIDNVSRLKNDSNQELFPEIEKPANEENKDDADRASEATMDGNQKANKPSRKGLRRALMIMLWIFTVIIIIPALLYYFAFPKLGNRLLRMINQYVDIRPTPTRPEIVMGQIKLQDIRQRIFNNNILGQIRIVEGTAVNQADYPVFRIAVKGEILDAYSVLLGERVTYAGNVLTDEELSSLSEEAMLTKLTSQQGGNRSNNKIMPNGMIPFMIVFAGEPGGVIKTTVKTVGAERLLSN